MAAEDRFFFCFLGPKNAKLSGNFSKKSGKKAVAAYFGRKTLN